MNPGPPPVAVFTVAAAAQRMMARRPTRLPGSLAAAVIARTSGLLALAGVGEFVRRRTSVDPRLPTRASTLVTTGANALTRNPMYVGLLGMLVAHAVTRRRVLALIPAAGFWWMMDRYQIPAEERALADRFGKAYEDYCRSVPRWLRYGRPGSSCGGAAIRQDCHV